MKYLILVVIALLVSCSTPVIPAPQMGTVTIESPGEQEIYLDGLYMGETPQEIIIIENYPNYLQVGIWKFLLWPPCTYAIIDITPDEHPKLYPEDQLLMEWNMP